MEYLQTLRNLAYLLIQLICLLHHFCFVNNFQSHKIANLTCNHQDLYIKGSVIFAGLFPIHHTRHNKTSSEHSKGKFSIGGFAEAMAMIYALGRINNDSTILPGITIGTEIIDTWSSVDVAIRKCLNLSFVKENMEARTCQQKGRSEKDPRTVVIIGSGSTDVAMAVTDLAGLFHVPVIGYASSSRLLSNRARFRYFLRTVSSDTLMARAVIDVLQALKWNFVHAMYSDTDYGRSAIETFQHVLAESTGWKICIAVRKAVSKYTRQREMNDFIAEIQAAHNLKAKAVLLFTTLKDTERILKHFENLKKKDYVFISTDHYFGSTSKFRSSPEMLRRIVGVIPKQRLYDHPFLNYIELFKKDSFNCPWISESTGEPDFSQSSTYTPYVIDAVKAAALGLHQLLNCSKGERCQFSEEDFPALNRNDGFLKSIQNVQFKGESRDQVSFDSNGNGVGAYDITVVNTDTERWIPIGNWVSNTSNVHDIPANASFLDINLTKLEMLWKKVFNSSHELTSVCGKKCPPGHFMNLEERYPSCCWKCVPCSTNEISNYPVNTSCQSCSALYRPNGNHSHCLPMTPTSVKLCDPAGIAICVVSIIGIIIVFFIVLVIYRNRNTHIMQASNRTLNYVLLFGIFLGYVTAPLPLLERTATLCAILLFTFSISFCIIVAALFIKTNRIYRVFSKSTTRKGTTSCVSDRWMLLFLAIFVSIETAICLFIVSTTPTSDATHVLYSDVNNKAYLQCRLASYTNYNMALWWSYNAGIVVVCTYQALLTRKVPGNNNEARSIAFNMMTISAEILIFFFCYYATNTFYRDILTSSFLIVMDTVTIICTFLPKAYVIMFRPEKNGAQRSEKNPATFKESSNSDEK